MRKLLTIILLLVISAPLVAQQDPLYSLYMNNPFVINPAYAGFHKQLNAQLSYRTQWMGLDGNPTTANFSAHSSVYGNRAGVGIQVVQDVIGENQNTELQGAFSYRLNLGESTLSFGMQAGLINFSSDPGKLTIRHPDDPYYPTFSEFAFNTGAGFLLTSDRYIVGLSVPRMLPAQVRPAEQRIEVYNQTMYATATYLFFLSEKVRFKPTVLLKASKSHPVSADVVANFQFMQAYSAGVFTRNLHTYGVLGSFRYKKLLLAYAFELPSARSVGTAFTSHEITLGFRTSVFRFHDSMEVSNF